MSDLDEEDEERWCDERRAEVVAYLTEQKLNHGDVGEWPAWHVARYVSIWAVESLKRPGWVGWWAICGDLPTDYCTATQPAHPRNAAREFSQTWAAAVAALRPGDATLGDTGLPASLAPLLQERAGMLAAWAEDDSIWPDT